MQYNWTSNYKMPVSLRIEPADFVVPSGPVFIFVKVHRKAFQYLDPSMIPLSDTDSGSTVKRKGKAAVEQVRRQLSVKLFGGDIPCSDITKLYPDPDFPTFGLESMVVQYIGFHWKRDVPAGELSPAVVELTSEPVPVDTCLQFHAVELVDEGEKEGTVGSIFRIEASRAKMEAERVQAAQASLE